MGATRVLKHAPIGRRDWVGAKNNPRSFRLARVEKAGDDLLSRGGSIIGMLGLTAVFGMGTGGTPALWSPAKGGVGC